MGAARRARVSNVGIVSIGVLLLFLLMLRVTPARGQTQGQFLEVVVVADHALFVREGLGTQALIDTLFARVAQIYATELGLSVSVIGTIVNEQGDPWSPVPAGGGSVRADDLLFDFSDWARANLSGAHDAAVLLSGLDFSGTTIGLAFLDTICTDRSHAIVQTGLTDAADAVTIAHEIGHLLSMQHDGANGCSGSGFLMTPSFDLSQLPSRFSLCSELEYQDLLGSGGAPCLADLPSQFVWSAGPLGVCSVACGGGVQARSVSCIDGATGMVAPDASCDPDLRPPELRSCNEHVCGPLTTSQQRCVKEQSNNIFALTREQGAAVLRCAKEYARGSLRADLLRLGGTFSADLCFDADVRGKIAARADKLSLRQDARCTGIDRDGIPVVPPFGFVSATIVTPAARSAPIALLDDLLGPAADEALVFNDPAVTPFDKQGAACQEEVIRRTRSYYDELWKETRKALAAALRERDFASAPIPPPRSAEDLAQGIRSWLLADPKRRLARRVDQLVGKTDRQCASSAVPTTTPIPTLFPGACQGDAQGGAGALAACAARSTRCHFCRQLEISAGFAFGCDEFDDQDGANASCSP